MKISKQARREAKELFRSCIVNGVVDEGRIRQAIERVAAEKPRGFLAILSHFQRLVKLDLARRTATVQTAVPINPALRQTVEQNLLQHYGPGLIFSFEQNSALIGGMRVQVGSDVYEGSISARLRDLEQTF